MIRAYQDTDYGLLKELYQHGRWYGGQFDEARDGRKRLVAKIADDPESIWVYAQKGELVGSISLVDDGRVAWLFRFVVKDNDQEIAKELYAKAISIFKKRGHTQILVYSPTDDEVLANRYKNLDLQKGGNYTAYWADI